MPIDLQGRTQYLELALFSQNVVGALLDFLDKDQDERLAKYLKDARASLDAVNSGDLNKLLGERIAAFSSYEQLRTLKEVWSEDDQKAAAAMIRDLLAPAKKVAAKKEMAERLVKLFSKLQNQALRHFEQPADPVAVG